MLLLPSDCPLRISTFIDNNVPDLNLINTHDEGRYVQQSYYSGPQGYRGAHWAGHPWNWNPISAGDKDGHVGTVLKTNVTQDHIYLKSNPLQWALDDVFCNCTFETYVTVARNGAFVRNRLKTYRYDTTDYGAHPQETPAVYTIGELSELWTYNGTKPWKEKGTKGLHRVDYPIPGPPWANFEATENWAAFTDSHPQHYGVGVMHVGVSSFKGGFSGQQGHGHSSSPNTGYIAPVSKKNINAHDEWVWCYHLSLGYLSSIRSYFDDFHNDDACTFPAVEDE